MPNKSLPTHWIVAAVILLVVIVAGGGYLLLHQARHAPPAQVAAASTTPAPATTAPPEYHPISQAAVSPAPASTAPLPALDDSDGMVRDAWPAFGGADAGKLLTGGSLIQRIVATINALPGRACRRACCRCTRPSGTFTVKHNRRRDRDGTGQRRRYAPYAEPAQQADTQQLVAWYVHSYPLFEQAWRQLGYPNTQFNDRLVQVLDLLLKTPVPAQPPKLEGAAGVYRFADPQLENLAIGQKLLLRLGPTQETAALAKLRAIRAALVGQHPSAPPLH